MKRFTVLLLAMNVVVSSSGFAAPLLDKERTSAVTAVDREQLESLPSPRKVEEILVVASKEDSDTPFLSDVKGTQIYAGKKATRVNLAQIPKITNNNHRQALIKVPGLYLSE